MTQAHTVASLFMDAAKRLRAEFEYIRTTNPHSGEKGAEVEDVLKVFLNQHLPQRFKAGSGIVIDTDNVLSRQQDVIVYDALSSPLYRYAEKTQIVPRDSVASVIEVKSNLGKSDLTDAYEKVASFKRLKQRRLSEVDREAKNKGPLNTSTNGIIFTFDTGTSIETIAEHARDLNTQYPSDQWPDMIVVLDRGVITYAIQYPGVRRFAGNLMSTAWPIDAEYTPPAWFIHLVIHRDEGLSLNRFFLYLLSQLNFFPYRSGVPEFKTMLEGAPHEIMTMHSYQFDLTRTLKPAPKELTITKDRNPTIDLQIVVRTRKREDVGVLQFLPWQDGSVIRVYGPPGFAGDIMRLLKVPHTTIMVADPSEPNVALTTIIRTTEEEFRKWPRVIEHRTNLRAQLETTERTREIRIPKED